MKFLFTSWYHLLFLFQIKAKSRRKTLINYFSKFKRYFHLKLLLVVFIPSFEHHAISKALLRWKMVNRYFKCHKLYTRNFKIKFFQKWMLKNHNSVKYKTRKNKNFTELKQIGKVSKFVFIFHQFVFNYLLKLSMRTWITETRMQRIKLKQQKCLLQYFYFKWVNRKKNNMFYTNLFMLYHKQLIGILAKSFIKLKEHIPIAIIEQEPVAVESTELASKARSRCTCVQNFVVRKIRRCSLSKKEHLALRIDWCGEAAAGAAAVAEQARRLRVRALARSTDR